jgi:hypothetical protein
MSRSNRWASDGISPGALELAMIQRGIDQTIRAVAADRYDPIRSQPSAGTVTVANAPRVAPNPETPSTRSERDEIDLRIPPGQNAIRALCDHFLPPAPPTLASIRASIAAIPSAMRKEMLQSPTLKAELRAMLEEAEARP